VSIEKIINDVNWLDIIGLQFHNFGWNVIKPEKFNAFFSTVADKIGEDIVYDPATRPSILEI
jgi:hypothetical protein